MPEEKKDHILRVLKEIPDEKLSLTQLRELMKEISYPTLLKWISVLEAEKKVRIDDYGNIKFVYLNKEYFKNAENE